MVTEKYNNPTGGVSKRHKIAAALFWAVLLFVYVWYAKTHDIGPQEALEHLAGYATHSQHGPLVFVAAYMLLPLLLFSASLLTLFSGFLYGPFWGVVYTVIGSSCGASLAYVIGKFFGADFVNDLDRESLTGRYAEKMRDNAFSSIVVMRLMLLPFDLVNFLCGATRVKFSTFLAATVIGSFPATFSMVLLGSSADLRNGLPEFDPWSVVVSSAVILSCLGLARFLKRKFES